MTSNINTLDSSLYQPSISISNDPSNSSINTVNHLFYTTSTFLSEPTSSNQLPIQIDPTQQFLNSLNTLTKKSPPNIKAIYKHLTTNPVIISETQKNELVHKIQQKRNESYIGKPQVLFLLRHLILTDVCPVIEVNIVNAFLNKYNDPHYCTPQVLESISLSLSKIQSNKQKYETDNSLPFQKLLSVLPLDPSDPFYIQKQALLTTCQQLSIVGPKRGEQLLHSLLFQFPSTSHSNAQHDWSLDPNSTHIKSMKRQIFTNFLTQIIDQSPPDVDELYQQLTKNSVVFSEENKQALLNSIKTKQLPYEAENKICFLLDKLLLTDLSCPMELHIINAFLQKYNDSNYCTQVVLDNVVSNLLKIELNHEHYKTLGYLPIKRPLNTHPLDPNDPFREHKEQLLKKYSEVFIIEPDPELINSLLSSNSTQINPAQFNRCITTTDPLITHPQNTDMPELPDEIFDNNGSDHISTLTLPEPSSSNTLTTPTSFSINSFLQELNYENLHENSSQSLQNYPPECVDNNFNDLLFTPILTEQLSSSSLPSSSSPLFEEFIQELPTELGTNALLEPLDIDDITPSFVFTSEELTDQLMRSLLDTNIELLNNSTSLYNLTSHRVTPYPPVSTRNSKNNNA